MSVTEPTLGELTRITVRGRRHSVDLVVPTQAPLVEWWPSLMRAVVHDDDPAADGWSLVRSDGQPITPDDTLGASGVRDGELLLLEPLDVERPAVVVTDVIEELTRASVPQLTLAARRPWMLGGVAAAVAAAIALTVVSTAGDPFDATLPLGVLAALLLAVTALLALRIRDERAAVVTGLLATVAGAAATGCLVVDSGAGSLALMLRTAAVALLLQAVLLGCGIVVRGIASGVIWALVPPCVGALIALVLQRDVGVAAVIAVALLTLALPAAPRGAAYLARLTALPGRTGVEVDTVEGDADPEADEGALAVRSTHARRVQTAVLGASMVVLVVLWVVLLGALSAPWSWLMVATSGIAVAATSRAFGGVAQVYLLTITGLAGVAAGLVSATISVGTPGFLPYLAWPLVVIAAGLLLAGLDTRLDLPVVGLLRGVRALSLTARAALPVLVLGSAGALSWAWSTGMQIGSG